jgi:hypothetical protein
MTATANPQRISLHSEWRLICTLINLVTSMQHVHHAKVELEPEQESHPRGSQADKSQTRKPLAGATNGLQQALRWIPQILPQNNEVVAAIARTFKAANQAPSSLQVVVQSNQQYTHAPFTAIANPPRSFLSDEDHMSVHLAPPGVSCWNDATLPDAEDVLLGKK